MDKNYCLMRYAESINIENLVSNIKELQIPCPWGDLAEDKRIKDRRFLLDIMTDIPLRLVVGCGNRECKGAYIGMNDDKIIIMTDMINYVDFKHNDKYDYIEMDIKNPDMVNLFGYKVHAIMSIMVFTYDDYGVNFPSKQIEKNCAKSLSNLLMPGGIFMNHNSLSDRFDRFENVLIKNHGYKEIYCKNGSIIIQKPF